MSGESKISRRGFLTGFSVVAGSLAGGTAISNAVSFDGDDVRDLESQIGQDTFQRVRAFYDGVESISDERKDAYAANVTEYMLNVVAPNLAGDVANATMSGFLTSIHRRDLFSNTKNVSYQRLAVDGLLWDTFIANGMNATMFKDATQEFYIDTPAFFEFLSDNQFPQERIADLKDSIKSDPVLFNNIARYGAVSLANNAVNFGWKAVGDHFSGGGDAPEPEPGS